MRALLFILISVMLFSCEKEDNINVLNTSKGGSATITVRSGSPGMDSLLFSKTFTAKSLGMYKKDERNYVIILENIDASGKVIDQLSFECTYYSVLKSSDMKKGQFFLNDGSRYAGMYTMAKNASTYILLQDTTVGEKISATFEYSVAKGTGFYSVRGTLNAYRLPDVE